MSGPRPDRQSLVILRSNGPEPDLQHDEQVRLSIGWSEARNRCRMLDRMLTAEQRARGVHHYILPFPVQRGTPGSFVPT